MIEIFTNLDGTVMTAYEQMEYEMAHDTRKKYSQYPEKVIEPFTPYGNNGDDKAVTEDSTFLPVDAVPVEKDPNNIDQHVPGAKLDAGKNRWDLLPLEVVEGVVKVMTFGASKYTPNGWKEVPEAEARYFSAMMRHYRAIQRGEYLDPDSGLPHWMHFVTNAVFLGYFYNEEEQ